MIFSYTLRVDSVVVRDTSMPFNVFSFHGIKKNSSHFVTRPLSDNGFPYDTVYDLLCLYSFLHNYKSIVHHLITF